MARVYIPYVNNNPAAVEVNGHRLLILTTAIKELEKDLALFGASEIRELKYKEGSPEESKILADLAANIRGGVVLTPPGIAPSQMIHSLSQELPWIH